MLGSIVCSKVPVPFTACTSVIPWPVSKSDKHPSIKESIHTPGRRIPPASHLIVHPHVPTIFAFAYISLHSVVGTLAACRYRCAFP
jgi:hypothetical protein